jgi:hypothetical protein
MSDLYPLVDVVALLIGRDGRLLLDYNEPWSAFCLPITKIHDLPATVPSGDGREQPIDAAVRAAVEMLGTPLSADRIPRPIEADIPPYQQSGRDGHWKRYKFHVFGLKVNVDAKPLPGHVAIWLKPGELATHQPISPTIKVILDVVPKDVLAKLLA